MPNPPMRADAYDEPPDPIVIPAWIYAELCLACRATSGGIMGIMHTRVNNDMPNGYDLYLEGLKIEMEPL